MTKTRKKILFVLYVLLLGVVLLYILFPSDAVRNYLVNRIQQDVPDLQVSIGDLKLSFPLTLSMKNVIFLEKETILFSAEQLELQPKWISLVTSAKAIKIRANAYQGKLSGVISSVLDQGNGHFSITGTFSELQLEQIPVLQEKIDVGLSGRVSGQFYFDEVSVRQAFGGGDLFVTDCTVIPSEPILDMDRLSFQRIDLAFAIDGNMLELQQIDFQGTELNATLSGSIIFESPKDRSVLDLDIIVTPQRLFLSNLGDTIPGVLLSSMLSEQDEFNLRVTGSLGAPRVETGAMR